MIMDGVGFWFQNKYRNWILVVTRYMYFIRWRREIPVHVLKDCLEHFMCFCFNCLNLVSSTYNWNKIWYMASTWTLLCNLLWAKTLLHSFARYQDYRFDTNVYYWYDSIHWAKKLGLITCTRISAYFNSSTCTHFFCLILISIYIICVWYMFFN